LLDIIFYFFLSQTNPNQRHQPTYVSFVRQYVSFLDSHRSAPTGGDYILDVSDNKYGSFP